MPRLLNSSSSLFLAFAAVGALATAPGCGRSSSRANPNNGVSCADVAADDEAALQTCVPVAAAGAGCDADADCKNGQRCQDGGCMVDDSGFGTDCDHTSDCSLGKLCDLGRGSCVDCVSDDQCDVGLLCQNDGRCGDGSTDQSVDDERIACATNTDCPQGALCSSGECVSDSGPEISCESQADCDVFRRICKNGSCEACTHSGECAAGQVCEGGTCLEPSPPPGQGGDGGLGGLDDLFGGGGGGGGTCLSYQECENNFACDLLGGGGCAPCTTDMSCLDLMDIITGTSAGCCTSALQSSGFCTMVGACVPGIGGGGGGPGGLEDLFGGGGQNGDQCSSAVECEPGQGCANGAYGQMCGLCTRDADCRQSESCTDAGECIAIQ